ncbi:MAG: TIM barrel protein [Armatimonadia bacterium]|nr:TIM barrel protein [Armatimonadia bacterium]
MAERKWAYLASIGLGEMPVGRVAAELAALGYHGVELTLAHFDPRSMDPAELQRVASDVKAEGLAISELVVQQDWVLRDEAERRVRIELTKDAVKACADCGIPAINVFSGPAPWDPSAPKLGVDMTEAEAYHMTCAALDEVLQVAEDVDVDVALEAVFGMVARDYYTTMELLRRLPSDRLKINMDPSHFGLYRNDIAMAVKAFGDRIVHVHLKDVIGVPPAVGESFLFPLLGEGLIDWPGFFQALDDIGYAGFCSVEFESFKYFQTVLGGDGVAAAGLSMEQIKALAG